MMSKRNKNNMQLFIGSKTDIGIEVNIDAQISANSYLGYARLWLGGKFIGTIEENIYIKEYLITQLMKMADAPFFDDTSLSDSESKYRYFEKRKKNIDDNDVDAYRFNFGTLSDDFLIWAYRNCSDIIIIWKLIRNKDEINYSDLANYGNEVNEFRIKHSEFMRHVKFANEIFSGNVLQ